MNGAEAWGKYELALDPYQLDERYRAGLILIAEEAFREGYAAATAELTKHGDPEIMHQAIREAEDVLEQAGRPDGERLVDGIIAIITQWHDELLRIPV